MNNPLDDILANPVQRRWLLAGAAGLLILVAGVWWLTRNGDAPLTLPAGAQARAEALRGLQAGGVEWHEGKGGEVRVDTGDLAKARALVGGAGHAFPEPAGFELLDREDYTLSDFSQRLNYQRALEGELARTLGGLREVRSARVHLSIPKPELFTSQRTPAKASVILQLRDGQALSAESAAGIREIVASSVEGLKPDAVAILDDQGAPLAAAGSAGNVDERLRLARRIELDLERRVRELLRETWQVESPYVSVRAELDFDHVTAVRDGAVAGDDAVGMLTREQTTDAVPARDGVGGNSSASREYTYPHERIETEYASGRVKRLSIAVALPAGHASTDPARVEATIGAAIGLQPARGDQLVVSLAPAVTSLAVAGNDVIGNDVAASAPVVPTTTKLPGVSKAIDANAVNAGPPVAGGRDGFSMATTAVIAAASLALLVALGLAVRSARRRPTTRLDPQQREQLLTDLRRWLEESPT